LLLRYGGVGAERCGADERGGGRDEMAA